MGKFFETDSAVFFAGRWHALPAGGDGPTDPPAETPPVAPAPPAAEAEPEPDPNAPPEVPEDLSEVDEAQLRELHDSIAARVAELQSEVKTQADLDALNALRELAGRIHAEITRRIAEDQRIADELATLNESPLEPLPEGTPVPDPPAGELVGAGATAANLAAARTVQAAAEQNPPTPTARPRVALLASVQAETVQAGQPIGFDALGAAIDRSKRSSGKTYLAGLPSFAEMEGDPSIPEGLSTQLGAPRNMELIHEANDDWRARQADADPNEPSRQGAICGPFDIIRDIPDDFSTAEPVAGVFPTRPAGRLGYQYMVSIGLAEVAGGVAEWLEADQAAVDETDSETWKPCVEVTCPPIQDAILQAVVACLTYDITTEMSQPDRVRNFTNALMALKARVKEGRILQRIDALSHSYQFFGDYGALPAAVEALNTVLAQMVYADRMNESGYTLIVPPGVGQVLTIDRANKGYNPEDATSDVMAYLRANVKGVSSVVQSLDSSLGGEPGIPFAALTPITDPPTPVTVPYISGKTFRFRLVAPEAAIYSETGEMNLGTSRDSRLIRMNKTQFFVEEFFFLSKHGPQPWATVDVRLCADGSRAGLIDPAGCETS